jgi:hypothetical protein
MKDEECMKGRRKGRRKEKTAEKERVLVGNEEVNGQGNTDVENRNVVLLGCARIWKMDQSQFCLLCCSLVIIIHFILDPRK